MLEHQVIAVVWQIGRLVLVVAGVLLPWRFGLSAVAALWISAAIQAVCCVVLLGLMMLSIDREVVRRRQADAG
jgi:hypothetical protein